MSSRRSTNTYPFACLMCYPFYPHEETEYGIGNYAYELIRNYKKMGLNPHTITVGDLPQHMSQWPRREVAFLRALSSVHADVYHGVDAFSCKTAALLHKRPLISTIHDMVASFFTTRVGRLSYLYNELSMQLVRRSDAVIVPFNITKDQVASKYGINEEKIAVIEYGVDHAMFHPRKRHEDGKKRVLYIGQLAKLKGALTLLKAFKLVLSSVADAELIIGGKGEHGADFQRAAVSLGISRRVKFAGFIPYRELPDYYDQATVFVWPSHLGFGLTALQALACGVPVVAARSLDMPEFLGEDGILVEPGDHNELAEAIVAVLKDPNLRKSLSARGLRKARRMSWEHTAKKTLALYEELCS